MYTACFTAKEEDGRDFDISYRVKKEENSFYIECSVEGGGTPFVAALGSCKEDAAEKLALFFAQNALRPLHLEDVISDMHF